MKTSNFRLCILIIALGTNFIGVAQSWQWGKSGGSSASGTENRLVEGVSSIVADTNGNVYTLSYLGGTDAVVDGQPRVTYNFNDDDTDMLICSYSCTGNLRWSRVLGGAGQDFISGMGIDAQNNIYVTISVFRGFTEYLFSNVHFDTAVTLPISPEGESTNKGRLFLIKYNSDGVLQWYKSPSPSNLTQIESNWETSKALSVDPQGNSYWLCFLRNGSYCNGAYQVTTGLPDPNLPYLFSSHVLKYDSNGNFISGTPLAFSGKTDQFYPQSNVKFKRNHNNGKYYISGGLVFPPVTIGNQSYDLNDFNKYVCAFNSDGGLQWLRHNNNPLGGFTSFRAHDIAFDLQNNIYYAGGAECVNLDPNTPAIPQSWNGQQFINTDNYPTAVSTFQTLVKMDENGTNIWLTNSNLLPNFFGGLFGVIIKDSEVITASGFPNLKWQTITNLDPNPPLLQGSRANILRFNKETGQILSANFLANLPGGGSGLGALCTDSKGNIYGGGSIRGGVVVNSNNILYSQGGPDDFLVAKLGSNDCNFLATTDQEVRSLKSYPNPVQNKLTIANSESISYELYDVLGVKVKWGAVLANNIIDFENLPSGMYLLQTKNAGSIITTEKIIKE